MTDTKPAAVNKPILKKQVPMATVLKALSPALLGAVYFFGWRALAIFVFANALAFATEYFFTKRRGEPVTMAVFVTGSLFALSMPPNIPWWICGVGVVIAVAVGKELFGGFGRNVFNPALVGRAFIFVSFPLAMTGSWYEPFPMLSGGLAGGLGSWTTDAVTSATPLVLLARGESVDILSLILGNVSGSLGETSAILLIPGGLYMIYKRVASKEIVLSLLATYLVTASLCWLMGWGNGMNPFYGIFAGGFLYGTLFMATDPISAVASKEGKIAFGAIIGLSAMLIRVFGNFPEGMMFAILIGNLFGPIAEIGIKEIKARKTQKLPEAGAQT